MTVFITGGTSSIGRVLIKELAGTGTPMRVMVRRSSNRSGLELPGVEFVYGDVTDLDAVRKGMKDCQEVIHLAAIVGHYVPEWEWWQVNRDGSGHVLQTAYDLKVKSMVQVSSLSVLGPTRPGETADETRPIDIRQHFNLYQKTKYAADEIARQYAAKGLPVKIVYPGFGFGCSQATSHPSLQDQTLLRMAAGKPVAIMGSGRNRLCLAYYRDTVAGILLALQRGQAGDGYILGNSNLNFVEIWSAIAEVLGKEPPRRRIPLPLLKVMSAGSRLITGQPIFPPEFFEMIGLDWCFSNLKAREVLGWQPRSFNEAIAETWADYRDQGWTVRHVVQERKP